MENLFIPYVENSKEIDKIIKECSDLRNKAILKKEEYKRKQKEVFDKFTEFLKDQIGEQNIKFINCEHSHNHDMENKQRMIKFKEMWRLLGL